MTIENIWKDTNSNNDEDLSSLISMSKIAHLRSNNPLKKIKSNLFINLFLGLLICCLYIVLIFAFPIWQVQIAILIVLAFSVWVMFISFQLYRNIDSTVSASNSVLHELRKHHQSIIQWMQIQLKAALYIYPISAAGGFLMGGAVGSGKPVEVLIQKPLFIVILIVAVAILTPICHLLTKWMFKISFGKHIKALQKSIDNLEAEK